MTHKGSETLRFRPSFFLNIMNKTKQGTIPIPILAIRLISEGNIDGPVITTPSGVVRLAGDYLKELDREHFIVILLATSGKVIGIHTCHIGSLNSSVVRIADVFKVAILGNAASIIVAHNHPSGNVEPSREDIQVTRRLVEAGKLIDLPVRDSIILGSNGDYTSLAERGIC